MKACIRICSGAALIFLLEVSSAFGETIDLDQEWAIANYLGTGAVSPSQTFLELNLENALKLEFNAILKTGAWEVYGVVRWAWGRSFPVVWKDVQIAQNPEKFMSLPDFARYFIYLKDDPKVRLVVYFGEKYGAAMFNERAGHYMTAQKFISTLYERARTKSVYKAGILEVKDSGNIGFLRGIDDYKYDWDSLVLEDKQKEDLKTTAEEFFNNYDLEKWKKHGIPLNRGILLHGPPGTGKSLVAKVLISKILGEQYKNKMTYIHVSARHILLRSAVKDLYEAARWMSPAVVFIEDIDLIAGSGGSDREDIKNELLQQLSGLEKLEGIVTIATTNYGKDLDPALKRSKRLGFHLLIASPELASRIALFQLFTKKFEIEDLDFDEYGNRSEGWSGADIKEICELAIGIAIRQTSFNDKHELILKHEHMAAAMDERAMIRLVDDKDGEE